MDDEPGSETAQTVFFELALSHRSQSSPWLSFSPLQSTDTHTLRQQSYNHAVPTLTRLHLQRATNSAPSAFLCLCNHVIRIAPPFSKLSKSGVCVCHWYSACTVYENSRLDYWTICTDSSCSGVTRGGRHVTFHRWALHLQACRSLSGASFLCGSFFPLLPETNDCFNSFSSQFFSFVLF